MRQRVMIAMALSCNPEFLICDEPTTALDVTIQAQILNLINELKEKTGTAVMMITHDLGVIAEVADNVMVMYAGQVVEYTDVDTVFEKPLHPYTQGLISCIPKLGGQEESFRPSKGWCRALTICRKAVCSVRAANTQRIFAAKNVRSLLTLTVIRYAALNIPIDGRKKTNGRRKKQCVAGS